MKNYKEFPRESLGKSDFGTIVAQGFDDNMNVTHVCIDFGEKVYDKEYFAYFVDEPAEISEDFKLVGHLHQWVSIFSDWCALEPIYAVRVNFYRDDSDNCIIEIIGRKESY